jgi:putative restriction endonuclease
MNFYVGITDNKWFEFLAHLKPDEVNFWRPRATRAFRAIGQGAPFLFKLHRPHSYIVGGGFFVSQSFLPLSIAWDVFKKKNGAETFENFSSQIRRYRQSSGEDEIDPVIGCIVLTSPFFFERDDWIAEPEDWAANLVQGRKYNTEDRVGAFVWRQVEERLARYAELNIGKNAKDTLIAEEGARYGSEQKIFPRLGQGAFRVLVTDAYSRRCAITGEKTLPVLQAAHIKPYSESGPHSITNGLLLRSDLHILLDRGLITVTPDFRVEVSRRIREEYENGREYYALQGRTLIVPPREVDRPSTEFIEWHNQNVYVA